MNSLRRDEGGDCYFEIPEFGYLLIYCLSISKFVEP